MKNISALEKADPHILNLCDSSIRVKLPDFLAHHLLFLDTCAIHIAFVSMYFY